MDRIIAGLACLALVLMSLAACAPAFAEQEEDPALYNGKRIGVMTGSIHEELAARRFPDSPVSYYNDLSDLAIALKNGIIDCFTAPGLNAGRILREQGGLKTIPLPEEGQECAFIFPKTEQGALLCGQMNEFLRTAAEDGTIEELDRLWMSGEEEPGPVDLSGLEGKEPALAFVTSGTFEPFSYIAEGEPAGYDVDLAVRFCRAYGYGITIRIMAVPAMLAGMASGDYDFGGNAIVVTEERKESMLFSDPDYYSTIVLVVRDTGAAGGAGFLASVRESFRKTFVREHRWRLILKGIGTTILITVCSALFGTLLGFGICMLRRSAVPFCSAFAKAYIRLLQGTPIVVLLMILFYVIFAGSGLAGETVAIIGFSLNFAAYTAEVLRSGIEAVDAGQTEAALALGYPAPRAFFSVVMPQAAQHFLPVWKGEIISLVKSTSVVGYIAVQDLTRMSDLIRSRTYEAFFPLIATAVIYFLIARLLTVLLNRIALRITPNRKHRTVKGVRMQ